MELQHIGEYTNPSPQFFLNSPAEYSPIQTADNSQRIFSINQQLDPNSNI